ncbi:MAG TPA: glycoside hydrolase family 3 C-terminal domain-containing protein [Lacisediminihabitans sp.]|uniref:beta-glucosidase family protein n=1 Tax=Lacisediminihabitans sp. TaxID=2787631 RepID=UPI002ED7DB92
MSTTTTATTDFEAAITRIRNGGSIVEETALLLSSLTREEKLDLLDGDAEFSEGMAEMMQLGYNTAPIEMGRIDRIGLPGLRFSDGPRGIVMGHSTAFPVSMARGATWDVALEERIGRAIGAEMRAQGANFFGGVCINLPRHPAWGRAQETYSEDSYLLGEMGAALVRGVQRNAMAVAKHYALNSMENARFTVNVTADDATMHEVYLPHFRRVVEEGVSGIMTSYNSVNGEWAGQNETILEGVLREQWGFEGVTVSDFIFGLRDAATSLRAGLDVEEPFRQQRRQYLPGDLEAGRASWEHVERAARRILATQLRFYSSDLDPEPGVNVVFSDAHRALAREAAAEAMVLLKNDPVEGRPILPLDARVLGRVALIGRLAGMANTGDHGSSDVRSPAVSTPLLGLADALPNAVIEHVEEDDPDAAARAAAAADVAIVVVGYTAEDEGEYLGEESMSDPALTALFPPAPVAAAGSAGAAGSTDSTGEAGSTDSTGEAPASLSVMGQAAGGDRVSLRIRPIDAEIIRATVSANPRTVVVIVTAGAVITEEWRHDVPAVLLGWYSGSEGGAALADVLLGAAEPGGRLPYSIPTTEEHLPLFDRGATEIVYDRWHGQRLLDRDGHAAAYPIGYGLSYTSFELSELSLGPVDGEGFEAVVMVTNTGIRPGRQVVQLYARPIAAVDFPSRVLVGFAPVRLDAGESRRVRVVASTRPLQRWTEAGFVPASLVAVIEASAFAGDPAAPTAELTLIG